MGSFLSDRLLRTAGHCYLHLEYKFPHVVRINFSDKQTKQNSKRKERKKEKETRTGWARNSAFTGTMLQVFRPLGNLSKSERRSRGCLFAWNFCGGVRP